MFITLVQYSTIKTIELHSLKYLSSLESFKYWVVTTQYVLLEIVDESEVNEFWFLSPFWVTNQDIAPFKTVKICYLLPTILFKMDGICVVYMQMGRSK